jgi:YD repeat-containing protein
MRHIACIVMGVVLNHASFAYGAETIAYSYDVQGRLIKVVHSGSANTGVQSL